MRKPTIFHHARIAEALRHTSSDWQALDERIAAVPDLPCRVSDPDVFFPGEGARFAGRRAMRDERARVAALCRGCPVRAECLASALLRGETYGSWGGVCQPDFQLLQQLWEESVPPTARPLAGSAAVKETR